jgi:hypothetical protein
METLSIGERLLRFAEFFTGFCSGIENEFELDAEDGIAFVESLPRSFSSVVILILPN